MEMIGMLETLGPYVGYGGLVVISMMAFTIKQHSKDIIELKEDNRLLKSTLSDIRAGVEYIKGRMESGSDSKNS